MRGGLPVVEVSPVQESGGGTETTTTTTAPGDGVYLTPGSGLVWTDEGDDKGSAYIPWGQRGDSTFCAGACDSTPGCNGFAQCGSTCWLKHKTFDGPIADEPTKNVWGCTSYYYAGAAAGQD